MKKQIFVPAFLVAIFLWSGNIQAQVEDVANPLLKYVNRNNGLRFTAGGRLFTDVAYYHSEYTPMKSGAAITDARIRSIFMPISIFLKVLSNRRIFSDNTTLKRITGGYRV